jgi:putative membrane protein
MTRAALFIAAAAGALAISAPAQAAAGPTDPQIAHIAYTAGSIDIAAAKQALKMSHNATVRDFAQQMVRDHEAVNAKALALVKKLHVTPEANATSASLSKSANAELAKLSKLKGAAYDREYLNNEVAFHKAVNGALKSTLIPSADNAELKSLLETGLSLFQEHQAHAEQVAAKLKSACSRGASPCSPWLPARCCRLPPRCRQQPLRT